MNAAPRIVTIGETFSATLALSADSVKTFATLVNDLNPLHHDEAYAAQSRFGGLIASGTQPTAHFMALLATHFSTYAQPLGLDCTVKPRVAKLTVAKKSTYRVTVTANTATTADVLRTITIVGA